MRRGVILSIKKRFVTLLTPEGEFVKVKKQDRHYEIGEEVVFFTPVRVNNGCSIFRFRLSGKKSAVLSLATSIVILLAILPTFFTGHVSAYMTIDVNPSIELELNDRLEVLSLTGLNKDGSLVIGKLSSWKGKDVKYVTNSILKVTKEMGYFKEKKQIVVSTTLLDKDADLQRSLNEEMTEITQAKKVSKTEMKFMQASEKDRKEAKEEGISTGRYLEKKQKEKKQTNEKETNKQSSPIIGPDKATEKEKEKEKEKDIPDENSKKQDNGIINENRSTNSEKKTVNSQSQAPKTKEVLHKKAQNLGTSQKSSSAKKTAPHRKVSQTTSKEQTGDKKAGPKRKTELKQMNKKGNESQKRRNREAPNPHHPTVNKKSGPRQPVEEIKQKRKPSNMAPPGQVHRDRRVPKENHTETHKHGRNGKEARVRDHHNK